LARALARERLHLVERPKRRVEDDDLLWSGDGVGYKVTARSVRLASTATTFEVAAVSDADYLLGVFLEKETFRLIGMIRMPWSMVEWLGRPHGMRRRLRWSEGSPVEGIAERL